MIMDDLSNMLRCHPVDFKLLDRTGFISRPDERNCFVVSFFIDRMQNLWIEPVTSAIPGNHSRLAGKLELHLNREVVAVRIGS